MPRGRIKIGSSSRGGKAGLSWHGSCRDAVRPHLPRLAEEKMKSTTSVLRFSCLATLAGIAAAGCAAEEYYCDATGCFYCDGIGCRRVDPAPTPASRGG